ncbi:GDP-mannose 4,6-dehydratase [Sulfurimonas sp.]|uniref:GDP-mannose 4,6-dehydratase n=1 Tax=Sulfurimonas sp. TaxID=2022749 RepID=UPI003569F4DD
MIKAIITGINGQDGFYLAKLLHSKGYEIHGLIRHNSLNKNLDKEVEKYITLHYVDFDSFNSVNTVIDTIKPHELYHLAAHSFIGASMDDELKIMRYNVNLTHYILLSIKQINNKCKVFFAGSSEMFGEPELMPQNESINFNPKNIYGISKVSASLLVKYYREKENMFTCTGILYNHESPMRKINFVTRKITSSIAKIKLGILDELYLGNIDTKRDWGHAQDYVYAMWLMLQNNEPKDYVISTGKLTSIREFLQKAFSFVGLDYMNYVKIDEKFYRPSEKIFLCGDSSLIKNDLNWEPTISLDEIIAEMIENDIKILKDIT